MTAESEVLNLVMNLPAGYCVTLYGLLYIRALEDGDFAVGDNDLLTDEIIWEEVFSESEEAVKFFVDKRHEKEFGADHEANRKVYEDAVRKKLSER